MSNLDPKAAAANRLKLCFLWGFISALAGAFVTLGLFFAGFQEDVPGVELAAKIGGALGLAIPIVAAFVGGRAVRATVPPWDNFGYGAAFWAAFRILFLSLVLGMAFYLLYYTLINPGLRDVMLQQRVQAMAAKGVSDSDIQKTMGFQTFALQPVGTAIFGLVIGSIFDLLIALILAIFLKRSTKALKAYQPPPL